MSGRRKRRGSRKVKVTYADGRVEYVKPSVFRPTRKQKRADEYERYLRSDEWRQKRKKVLHRDGRRCTECGARDHLQVHHLTYERFKCEQLADLVTLCASCHRALHRIE